MKNLIGKVIPFLTTVLLAFSTLLNAQVSSLPANTAAAASPNLTIGGNFGYDLPLFNVPYKLLGYKGGRYIGAHLDYNFVKGFGFRANYADIITSPNIKIPDEVFYTGTPVPVTKQTLQLKRRFVGFGPGYRYQSQSKKFSASLFAMGGYAWLNGGDAYAESTKPFLPPSPPPTPDILLYNTGFSGGSWSGKVDLDFKYRIKNGLHLNLGFYYLRHFGAWFDNSLDLNGIGQTPYHHYELTFDDTRDPFTVDLNNPYILQQNSEEPVMLDLASVGAHIGLNYEFGLRPKIKEVTPPVETVCDICCPNDGHKILVTVRDKISGKVIPGADAVVKDMQGNVVATGTTNSYGTVDFGEVKHGNYITSGNVFGIETTTETITDSEFFEGAIIRKEVVYDDLRFILKGKTLNKMSRNPEPNVIVSLTNQANGNVKQDNSDGKGDFSFRLDKDSRYEVIGSKEKRLSEIEGVTTVGLTRSTTLFVDLELGMDNFDCGQGTVLDIKYEFNDDKLTASSKFELDRLVRYMSDHNIATIELSSHTDSRGKNNYNLDLSNRRAQSAVNYIIGKGISRDRIRAQGYGETRLLNQCQDGVNCSEAEHLVNRRTEAQLICN